MSSLRLFLALFALMLTWVSCRTKPKYQPLFAPAKYAATASTDAGLKPVVPPFTEQRVAPPYLTSKAKVIFRDATQNMSLSASIRMVRDTAIWMSLSPGLGIEAARVLLTPDSVFMQDYVMGTGQSRFGYEGLSVNLRLKVTFAMLQELFLGNMPFPQEQRDSVYLLRKGSLGVKQMRWNYDITNVVDSASQQMLNFQGYALPDSSFFYAQMDQRRAINPAFPQFAWVKQFSWLPANAPDDIPKTTVTIEHSSVQVPIQRPELPFPLRK